MSDYEMLQELGAGGFGSVRLARRRSDGQFVAIKTLLPKMARLAHARRRFAREAEILGEHAANPNVVDLIEADLVSPNQYIVLEFCNGGSLDSWVATRRPAHVVALVIAEAATGLSHLHAPGGFHRDVKPGNILMILSADHKVIHHVKLSDFGLARHPKTGRSMTATAAGTEGYMAPEVTGGAAFTGAADIYSLGITAIELLTGSRDPAGVLSNSVPAALRPILQRMVGGLAPHRPSALEVADAMRAASHSLTAPAVRTAAPPPRPVPAGADPGGVLAVMAVVGLVALGGAMILASLDE